MHGFHVNLWFKMFQLNRVKSIEKEKDELEEAKKEAEEFLAMKTDVAKKQHTLYQRYMSVVSCSTCSV